MPVLKDRRFRDMRLTEEDVQMLVNAHPTLWERLTDGKLDPESGAWETDTTALDRFTARAKRLLPLWREWGLKRLKAEGHSEGYAYGVNDARYGRFE